MGGNAFLNSSNNTGSFGLKYSKDEGVGVDWSYDMQDRLSVCPQALLDLEMPDVEKSVD